MKTLSITKDKYSGYSYSNMQYDSDKAGGAAKKRSLHYGGKIPDAVGLRKKKNVPDATLQESFGSVRAKNGLQLQNNAMPNALNRQMFSGANKKENNYGKSPSSVSFGGLSSTKLLDGLSNVTENLKFAESIIKRFSLRKLIGKATEKVCANKLFKKALEKSADNGALCSASAMLLACGVLRPASIMASQNVELENRKIAAAKSIASGLIGFGLMFLVSKPIEFAVKKIDANPAKYLKPETMNNLIGNKPISQAKAYNLATRFFKISADMITAAPKGSLTILLIPPLLNALFKNKKSQKSTIPTTPENNYLQQPNIPKAFQPIIEGQEEYENPRNYVFFRSNTPSFNKIAFKGNTKKKNTVSFKGNIADKSIEVLAKIFGKIMDLPKVQKLANKYQQASIENHVMAVSGTIVSSAYVVNTVNSKKIPEERKGPLIYNSTISWALSTAGGYTIDKLLNNVLTKFQKMYTTVNQSDDNLEKQLRGIKIMKSALIFGMMYRWITPWISTILAEKVWNKKIEKTDAKK